MCQAVLSFYSDCDTRQETIASNCYFSTAVNYKKVRCNERAAVLR